MAAFEWKRPIRDGLVLWAVVYTGNWAVRHMAGPAGPDMDVKNTFMWLLAVNFVLQTGGFFVIGCLKRVDRFVHAVFTTVVVCLISLIITLAQGMSMISWLLGVPFVCVYMLLGTGFSFLAVRRPPAPAPPASPEPPTPPPLRPGND